MYTSANVSLSLYPVIAVVSFVSFDIFNKRLLVLYYCIIVLYTYACLHLYTPIHSYIRNTFILTYIHTYIHTYILPLNSGLSEELLYTSLASSNTMCLSNAAVLNLVGRDHG